MRGTRRENRPRSGIEKINAESFEKEAKRVGLGEKIAMAHFYEMKNKFPEALKKAARGTGVIKIRRAYDDINSKPQFDIYDNSINVILPMI